MVGRERLSLRASEAAEALGVSERTLREWMRHKGLPFARVGGVVLIPRAELVRWLSEQVEANHGADAIADQILVSMDVRGA